MSSHCSQYPICGCPPDCGYCGLTEEMRAQLHKSAPSNYAVIEAAMEQIKNSDYSPNTIWLLDESAEVSKEAFDSLKIRKRGMVHLDSSTMPTIQSLTPEQKEKISDRYYGYKRKKGSNSLRGTNLTPPKKKRK